MSLSTCLLVTFVFGAHTHFFSSQSKQHFWHFWLNGRRILRESCIFLCDWMCRAKLLTLTQILEMWFVYVTMEMRCSILDWNFEFLDRCFILRRIVHMRESFNWSVDCLQYFGSIYAVVDPPCGIETFDWTKSLCFVIFAETRLQFIWQK